MATTSRPTRSDAKEEENDAPAPRRPRVRKRPDPEDSAVVASLTPEPDAPTRAQILARELMGIVLLVASVFIAGALIFERAVPNTSCTNAAGPFGPVGGCVQWSLLGLL